MYNIERNNVRLPSADADPHTAKVTIPPHTHTHTRVGARGRTGNEEGTPPPLPPPPTHIIIHTCILDASASALALSVRGKCGFDYDEDDVLRDNCGRLCCAL